jgi:hypothetical protein
LYLWDAVDLVKEREDNGFLLAAKSRESILDLVVVRSRDADVRWFHEVQAVEDILDGKKRIDRSVRWGQLCI